jgi:hypothetical protein
MRERHFIEQRTSQAAERDEILNLLLFLKIRAQPVLALAHKWNTAASQRRWLTGATCCVH